MVSPVSVFLFCFFCEKISVSDLRANGGANNSAPFDLDQTRLKVI